MTKLTDEDKRDTTLLDPCGKALMKNISTDKFIKLTFRLPSMNEVWAFKEVMKGVREDAYEQGKKDLADKILAWMPKEPTNNQIVGCRWLKEFIEKEASE